MPRKGSLFYTPPDEDVHLIYHEFARKFKPRGGYVRKGWPLMKAVSRWAEKHPDQVFSVRCDAVFAGSDLILIEHASAREYFGATVLYIPQCAGEDPIEFFLYPGHRRALIAELRKLGKRRRTGNRK